MPKFMYIYHGGKMPESPEEGAKVMAAWTAWYEKLGPALADGGAPAGKSMTVTAKGVSEGGGANPVSGYTLVHADDMKGALEMAKGSPHLDAGGSVEIAEALEM